MPDRVPEMLEVIGKACPDIEFVHGSMTEYFRELKGYEGDLEEFHGELRHVARVTGKWYHALIPHCLASRYPLKRIGTPADAAAVARFLLSDESGWMTGQVLGVDGGMSTLRA